MPCTILCRDRIIASVNKRISRVTRKHGVELPTLVDYAKKTHEINDKILWMDAINREMENLKVNF